jgi:hypothetical protein
VTLKTELDQKADLCQISIEMIDYQVLAFTLQEGGCQAVQMEEVVDYEVFTDRSQAGTLAEVDAGI